MKKHFSQFFPLIISLLIAGGITFVVTQTARAPELQYQPIEMTGSDVIVMNQPSGSHMVVKSAETKTNTFITVHESLSGAPAQLVGVSSILPPGSYTDIPITLKYSTLPGYRYIILMMADDGDGVFELGVDLPIMHNGVVVKKDFVADIANE